MKAVTEFASFTINAATKAKAALEAEGKSAEDVQASLGTTYKCEGEKLGYLMKAIEVAATGPQNLKRVLVMKLAEGESAPPKSVAGEDGICYVAESQVEIRKEQPKRDERGGRGGKGRGDKGRGGDRGKEKSSPWGMSPEEKAAKAAKSQAAQASKTPKPQA